MVPERYQEREAKLVRLIESLEALQQSREWSTLKQELFDGILDSIDRRMEQEAAKPEINTAELYRLQGERKVAKKLQLDTLVASYRLELANIRKQTHPPQGNGEMITEHTYGNSQ